MQRGDLLEKTLMLGNIGNSDRLYFLSPKSLQMVTSAMKLKDACSLGEKQ